MGETEARVRVNAGAIDREDDDEVVDVDVGR